MLVDYSPQKCSSLPRNEFLYGIYRYWLRTITTMPAWVCVLNRTEYSKHPSKSDFHFKTSLGRGIVWILLGKSQPQTLQNGEVFRFVTLFSLFHLQNREWKPGPSQLPALSTKHQGCLCALLAPRLRPAPATQAPSCCPHTGEAAAAARGLVHGPVKLGDRVEEEKEEETGMHETPESPIPPLHPGF